MPGGIAQLDVLSSHTQPLLPPYVLHVEELAYDEPELVQQVWPAEHAASA